MRLRSSGGRERSGLGGGVGREVENVNIVDGARGGGWIRLVGRRDVVVWTCVEECESTVELSFVGREDTGSCKCAQYVRMLSRSEVQLSCLPAASIGRATPAHIIIRRVRRMTSPARRASWTALATLTCNKGTREGSKFGSVL